jgi:hypothetical protein
MVGSMANLKQRRAGLKPAAFRFVLAGRPARLRLGRRQWRRLFLEGLLAGGMDRACEVAGVHPSHALGARLRDRRFRAAWDAAHAERLTEAESLLLEELMAVLRKPEKDAPRVPDKAALAAWQAMRDERRRGMGPTAAERAAREAGQVPATAASRPERQGALAATPQTEAVQVEALIAQVAAGIAAAEARLGLMPQDAARPLG